MMGTDRHTVTGGKAMGNTTRTAPVAGDIAGTFCSFSVDEGGCLVFDVGQGLRRNLSGLSREEALASVVDAWLDAHPYGTHAVPAVRRMAARALNGVS